MSQEKRKAERQQRIEAVATKATESVFNQMITFTRPPEFHDMLMDARLVIALALQSETHPFRGEQRDNLIKRIIVEKATELYRKGHESGNFDAMCKALKLAETCPELCAKIDEFHDEILKDEPPISPEMMERQRARINEILDKYRPERKQG